MEKGINKHWTPEIEAHFEEMLKGMHSFGGRNFVMSMRDMFKYDGRSKQAKRALAQARLRLATATDKDIASMATLRAGLESKSGCPNFQEIKEAVEELKARRARFQAEGIKRSDLECQPKNT